MNAHLEGKENSVCLALQGRVPCRVVGKIQKGDLIVTSGIPGVGTAALGDAKVGSVVGKALESYDSDHIGIIEVVVGRV
jgi:cell shape-determining protein MreC